MPLGRVLPIVVLAACSAADPPAPPTALGVWGTSQHLVFDAGDELIENYLVLAEDGSQQRFFRIQETFLGHGEIVSNLCATGHYTLDGERLVSDLLVSTQSQNAAPSSQVTHEQARVSLVGPQLRVERTDLGAPAQVIVYDRLPLPNDLGGCSSH